jgi:hypothetical protein
MSKKNKKNYEVYDGPVSTDADIAAMIAGMVTSGEISTKGNKGAVATAPEEVFIPKQKHNGKKHNDVVDAITSALNYAASSMSNKDDGDVAAKIDKETVFKEPIVHTETNSVSARNHVRSTIGAITVRTSSNIYGNAILFRDNFRNSIITQIYPASEETSAIDTASDEDLEVMLRNLYLLIKLGMYPDCICNNLADLADVIKDINSNDLVVIEQNERYFVFITNHNYIDTVFIPEFIKIVKYAGGSVVGTIISVLNIFTDAPTLREFITTPEDNANAMWRVKEYGTVECPADGVTTIDMVEGDAENVYEYCYGEIYTTYSKLQENAGDSDESDYDGVPEDVYGDFNDTESDEDSEEDEDEEEIGASNDSDSFRSNSIEPAESIPAHTEPVGNTSGADEVQKDFEPFAEEVQTSSSNTDAESNDNGGRLTTTLGDILKDAGIVADAKSEQPSGGTVVEESKETKAQETQQEELGRSSSDQKAEEKKKEVDPLGDMVINIQTVGRK